MMKMRSFKKPIQSFEDLRGLRAVGYIRDSKLDQREGYGPDIQKNNEVRFAESYGLVLCDQFYTEFVSGRSMQKRKKFQQIIEARIPHLAQTSDAVNRQLSCFSSRYMNLLAVFQI